VRTKTKKRGKQRYMSHRTWTSLRSFTTCVLNKTRVFRRGGGASNHGVQPAICATPRLVRNLVFGTTIAGRARRALSTAIAEADGGGVMASPPWEAFFESLCNLVVVQIGANCGSCASANRTRQGRQAMAGVRCAFSDQPKSSNWLQQIASLSREHLIRQGNNFAWTPRQCKTMLRSVAKPVV